MGTVPTEVHPEYKGRGTGETMKALAWFGPEDVRIVDAPVPDITEPDDVIFKVTGTTICGSDLHLYHGEIVTLKKGDILGHGASLIVVVRSVLSRLTYWAEFMGIVDKVGPNVTNHRPGDRVVASFQIACGECSYCKQKLSSFCDRTNNSSYVYHSHITSAPRNLQTDVRPSLQNYMYGHRDAGFFGYSHFTGGFPGGQAEFVRVPKGNVNLLPVPPGVPDEKVLYLSDVLSTSYHCVVDTGINEGDTVGIWGLGPIGQCAAQFAKLKGAKRIIGIDSVPERLKFAQEKTGVEPLEFSRYTDVVTRLQKIIPGGLDVALDCGTFHEPKSMLHKVEKTLMLETDVPETINEALASVRKGGRVGVIAAYAGYANHVNLGALMEKGIRLIGNGQAPVLKWWKEILEEYILTGKFDPTL